MGLAVAADARTALAFAAASAGARGRTTADALTVLLRDLALRHGLWLSLDFAQRSVAVRVAALLVPVIERFIQFIIRATTKVD